MEREIKARLGWVQLFLETNNATFVCKHCGVSRPTLKKWVKRHLEKGSSGLNNHSKRPLSCPNKKINKEISDLILDLRENRNLGARRIQSELLRLNDLSLSLATIHKVLISLNAKPIKKLRRLKKFKRYQRPIPGDRVQMDTCKIAPGIYQYTAVDDCSRWRVLEIYKRRTATNTLKFLDKIVEQFPFPIQRIQTDRGREFFAEKVQLKMMEYCIKFRPIKPASPHLNGKVERSQKTDLEEFYALADLSDFEKLREELECWQFFYNWKRPHGALKGKTPSQIDSELANKTPFSDEIEALYDISREHVQNANFSVEMQLRNLKAISRVK